MTRDSSPATRARPRGARCTGAGLTGAQLDRPVLLANVVSGTLFLLGLAFVSWPLAVLGVAYVAAASVFLAAVYSRDVLTKRQEALTWATPWLAAVALWLSILAGMDEAVDWILLWFAVLIATPCYLAWQLGALAVRQLIAWRSTG
jgi:hypothetical protein